MATNPEPSDDGRELADLAASAGIRRIHMIAWRDLADVEAGGSEIHAAEIAKQWAEAGLEVTMRTSYAQGQASVVTRDGYRVIRRAGRYLVFPRAALSEAVGRHGPWDAMVEIWNGMPFLSPLWTRGRPSVVFLHHLHAEMWRMVLPENPTLARAGELLEARVAPLLYRRSRIVTLSPSSKQELVDQLGFRPDRVDVVAPGLNSRFSPGGTRSPHPLVVAVGRLVPVKRYDRLIRAAAKARANGVEGLELRIVGDGYERPALESVIDELDGGGWVRLVGRASDDEVVSLYRSAWVVASASAREGWGMTITEAAACGTPAVATRIPGHLDAVDDGVTGVLTDPASEDDLAAALVSVLGDADRRAAFGAAALARAGRYTWAATARGALEALVKEARRRR